MAESDWILVSDVHMDEVVVEADQAQQAERIAELEAAEIAAEFAHGIVRMRLRPSASSPHTQFQPQPPAQLQAEAQTKLQAHPGLQPLKQEKAAQRKPANDKHRSSELIREVRQMQSFFDRALVAFMLLAASAFYWLLLPSYLTPLFTASGFGLCAGLAVAYRLEVLACDGLMLLLLDIIVLVPYNALLFIAYYPTYVARMPLYQTCQCILIPLMTFGKVWKKPQDATFLEFLRVLPDAYNNILPKDPKLKPFDNIDEASQDDAALSIRNASFVRFVNRVVTNNIPKTALNSLGFRLAFSMAMCPTLGWWLVGPCYVPLLPVRSVVKQKNGEDNADRADSAEGADGADGADGSDGADDTTPGQLLPPVALYFPRCRFLKVVRDEFGNELGQQKCLNE